MFSLLKRKNKISRDDFIFLKSIIIKLPLKYSYLEKQVSEDFILGKKVNPLGEKGTFVLILNANLEKKYANSQKPQFFIIKDIGIFDGKIHKYISVELHILEGMLAGFKVNAKYSDLDYSNIDIQRIKEKHFVEEDKRELQKILANHSNFLGFDINGTFKIEIPEGIFYVIKNLGDGNYLSVDTDGCVYGMFFDPYLIEKIFDSPGQYVKEVQSGRFNVNEYYFTKME